MEAGSTRGLTPLLLCVGVALMSLADTSRADLVEADLFVSGDGLLTNDTDTGLFWLDLSETVGLSVQDIRDDSGGWDSLGFTHARPCSSTRAPG